MPIMTQATEASIATKVTMAQVNIGAQLALISQVTGLPAALDNKINQFKTSRDVDADFSISLSIDQNNVIRCINTTPINIFVFDNGSQDPPDNWTTMVIATDAQVTITTDGLDPNLILTAVPNSKLVLQQGDIAFIQKVRESGGNKYWSVWNVGNFLPLTGGTLTGALTLAADPASALQAATKQYVDNITSYTDVVEQTTNHTVVDADYGKLFYCDSTSNIVIDLPNARGKGFWCDFMRRNTGSVSFISDQLATDNPQISAQYSIVRAVKITESESTLWALLRSDPITGLFLPLTGGTITGNVVLNGTLEYPASGVSINFQTGVTALGSTTVNSLQTNTINERTLNSGVVIDGIKVKDGIISDEEEASGVSINTNTGASALGATTVNSLTTSSVSISGGSLDGVTIGDTTPSSAKIYTPSITETTTSRTLAISDINALIKTTNTGGNTTITIPTNASVAIPIGSRFSFLHLGGTTRLLLFSTTGITLNGPTPSVATGGYVVIEKTDTNTWQVVNAIESGTITLSLSGIWASSQNCTVYFSRNNYAVTMNIGSATATQNASDIITVSGWPTRLLPANGFGDTMRVQDGGSIIAASGWLDVIIGTGIFIYKTPTGGTFSGSGTGGPVNGSIIYPLI